MRFRFALLAALSAAAAFAQAPQKQDEEYTKLIKQYLQDPRISTELVDHMPASDKVPSPLKFLGRDSRHSRRTDLRARTSTAITKRSRKPRPAPRCG